MDRWGIQVDNWNYYYDLQMLRARFFLNNSTVFMVHVYSGHALPQSSHGLQPL